MQRANTIISSFVITICLLLSGVLTLRAQSVTPNQKLTIRPSFKFSQPASEESFIENKGQLADQFNKPMPEVLFSSDVNGQKTYLTKKGIHFVFSKFVSPNDPSLPPHLRRDLHSDLHDSLTLLRVDMSFVGANPNPKIESQYQSEAYYNYYLAHCKLSGVRSYRKIVYRDIYPKIDFVIYSKGTTSEYDFIIHPGADPSKIAMKYDGVDSLRCKDGTFKAFTALGVVEEDEPYSYQEVLHSETTAKKEIASKFILDGNVLRFQIGKYDKTRDLIIDPVRRMWGTYVGGSTTDEVQSPVIDKSNNIIVSGYTQSNAGISTSGMAQVTYGGNQDAFLSKFTQDGALIWATYYGGSNYEFSGGVAIDSNGRINLYGETYSSSGIATVNAHQTALNGPRDAFIAQFDNAGALQWATYFGGDGIEAVAGNRSIACDRAGRIYIIGSTSSTTGIGSPTSYQPNLTGNAFDNFIAKFLNNGTFLWSTYYGGAADEYGTAIAAEPIGNIFIGGYTTSTNYIAVINSFQGSYGGGSADGFIAKFSNLGSPLWSSYYGGTVSDYIFGLCTDSFGNVYGCGYSNSQNAIASAGTHQPTKATTGSDWDGFLVKFNNAGARQWGTYFGGSGFDFCEDVATNNSKFIVAGETVSTTNIATADGYQTTLGSALINDAFLARFDFNGGLITATYYGGNALDNGKGCTLDRDNNVVLAGETFSPSAIATPGTYKPNGAGSFNRDGFIVKFCNINPPILTLANDTICIDGFDTLLLSQGYVHTYWFDGATQINSLNDSTKYYLSSPLTPGTHSISVLVSNGINCDINSDTVTYVVLASPVVDAGADTVICPGAKVTLLGKLVSGVQPPKSVLWSPSTGLSSTKTLQTVATPPKTTTYYLSITDANGCSGVDSVVITINTPPVITTKAFDTICKGNSVVIGDTAISGKAPYTYSWTPKAGLSSSTVARPVASPTLTTVYTVIATDANGCQGQASVNVVVVPLPTPIISGPTAVCINSTESYYIKGGGKDKYGWKIDGGGSLSTTSKNDSVSITWTSQGKWKITVSDTSAQGCIKDTTLTITVNSTLVPGITPNGNVGFCTGDSIVLYCDKGYQTYLWNSGGSQSDSIIVKSGGKYWVSVASSNGCNGTSDTVFVTENSKPNVTISADGVTQLCTGDSVHLSATQTFSSYLWSTGEQTQTITVKTSGTYTLEVSNASGCKATSNAISVTVNSSLTPVITPQGTIGLCFGDSATLDAGGGYKTYQWQLNGIDISSATKQFLQVKSAGSYTVSVTTAGGCAGTSAPVVVNVNPLPTPTIILVGNDLSTQTYASYQWNLNSTPIIGATNQTVTLSTAGDYSVTVTDANGCKNTSAFYTYTVKNATVTVAVANMTTANPGDNISIPITLSNAINLLQSGAKNYVGQFRFNSSLLISRNATPLGVMNGAERVITITGNNTVASGVLATLDFTAALGTDSCTSISIDTFYWTDAPVDVTRVNGAFCLTGICSSGGQLRLIDPNGKISIQQPYPNPATSIVHIDFEVAEAGVTRILVSDLLGKHIATLLNQELKPGAYSITTDVSSYSSGQYLYSLQTPTLVLTKLLKVSH